MTEEALKARRQLIVKRVAVMKRSKTWAQNHGHHRKPEEPFEDYGGVPETDAVLDELPDSLVG